MAEKFEPHVQSATINYDQRSIVLKLRQYPEVVLTLTEMKGSKAKGHVFDFKINARAPRFKAKRVDEAMHFAAEKNESLGDYAYKLGKQASIVERP